MPFFTVFDTSQVVQDFSHQQQVLLILCFKALYQEDFTCGLCCLVQLDDILITPIYIHRVDWD